MQNNNFLLLKKLKNTESAQLWIQDILNTTITFVGVHFYSRLNGKVRPVSINNRRRPT